MKPIFIAGKKITMNYKNIMVITSIFLAAVFLTAAALQSYHSIEGYILNRLDSINTGIVDQTAKTVENHFNQLKKTTEYIASDQMLIDYIRSYESGSLGNRPELSQNIKSRIGIMVQFNPLIHNIVVVTGSSVLATGLETAVYNLNYPLVKQSEYRKHLVRTLSGEAILIPPMESDMGLAAANFSFIRNSYCYASVIQKNGTEYGCVFVVLKPEKLNGLLSRNTLLIHKQGVFSANTDASDSFIEYLLNTDLTGAENEIRHMAAAGFKAYYRHLNTIDMSIAYLQKNSDFTENMMTYRSYLFIALVITIALAFFLSGIISNRIILPLKKLKEQVRNYSYENNAKLRRKNPEKEKSGLLLRESILGYLIGVVIVPVSIYLVVSYYVGCSMMESYVISSYSGAFEQAAENVNYYMESKEKIIKNIVFNLSVQESLSKENNPMEVPEIVSRSLKLDDGRGEVFIYTQDKHVFYANAAPDTNTIITEDLLEESRYKRTITSWVNTAKDDYGRPLINLLVAAYWNAAQAYDLQDGKAVWAGNTKRKESGGGPSCFTTISADQGKTWSDPTPFQLENLRWGSPYGRIVNAPDGTLLMSFYGIETGDVSGEGNTICLIRSKDGGKTWGDESIVARDYNETSFAFLPDGTLVAAARNWSRGAFTSILTSRDMGYTWSEPRQVTRKAEHPADLTLLQSGKLLMTFGRRVRPMGCGALISEDGGDTWDTDREILLAGDGIRNTDLGYPSTVQLDDGTIITALYYASGSETSEGHFGWGDVSCQAIRYREGDIA